MKLTKYLEQREVGFVPKRKRLRATAKSEILIEKQSVSSLKNTPCKLSGQTRATFLVDFSRDRTKVASTHGDHTVRVSDIVSGKCLHTLVGHPRTPWCVAFHPSSNDILASGCLGGDVRIWDLHGGGSEVWHAPNNAVIASLTFHPTDHVLLFATTNTVYFWDWSQPNPFAVCSTSMEYERVRWLGFDPLGQYIYTGITNVSNTQREDPPNVVHIRNPTGHNPHPQHHNTWSRYQHLVERFHSYQQDRSRHQEEEEEEEEEEEANTNTPSRLSPVHVDSIQLARQYAAEVTAMSGRSRHRPRPSPLPVNFLWDNERMAPRQHRMFTEFRSRTMSPPPLPSSEDDDALVEEEIDRLNRSIIRHSDRERVRPRAGAHRERLRPRVGGHQHRARSDRAQRRLAILTAFLRYRERNRETRSNPPPPRLIDRLNHINEEIQQVISSALDQPNPAPSDPASLSAPPSLFSAVPRVTPGFPPARRVRQRPATLVSPSRLTQTSSTSSSNSSTSRPPREAASVARIFERRLISGCLSGRGSLDPGNRSNLDPGHRRGDNLVVQRQSDDQTSRVDSDIQGRPSNQPPIRPSGGDNSCSRTRPQTPGSSWRMRQLSSLYPRPRSSRRFSLSRTPRPESLADNSEESQSRIHTLPNTPNLFARSTLPATASATSSLLSPNSFTTASSTESTSWRRSSRSHPVTRGRAVVTDQTSQTTGAMNLPECLDQGTDVIGLDGLGQMDQDGLGQMDQDEVLDGFRSTDQGLDGLGSMDQDGLELTDQDGLGSMDQDGLGSMDQEGLGQMDQELGASDQELVELFMYEESEPDNTDFLRYEPMADDQQDGRGDNLLQEVRPSAVVPPTGSHHGEGSSSSDLASVSSLCQFVNHYNQASPINITSRLGQSGETTLSQSRSVDSRLSESRATEPRSSQSRLSQTRETESILSQPRSFESTLSQSRSIESIFAPSRSVDSRETTLSQPRETNPRLCQSRTRESTATVSIGSVLSQPRSTEPTVSTESVLSQPRVTELITRESVLSQPRTTVSTESILSQPRTTVSTESILSQPRERESRETESMWTPVGSRETQLVTVESTSTEPTLSLLTDSALSQSGLTYTSVTQCGLNVQTQSELTQSRLPDPGLPDIVSGSPQSSSTHPGLSQSGVRDGGLGEGVSGVSSTNDAAVEPSESNSARLTDIPLVTSSQSVPSVQGDPRNLLSSPLQDQHNTSLSSSSTQNLPSSSQQGESSNQRLSSSIQPNDLPSSLRDQPNTQNLPPSSTNLLQDQPTSRNLLQDQPTNQNLLQDQPTSQDLLSSSLQDQPTSQNLLSSLGLTPTPLTVSNTVVVSSSSLDNRDNQGEPTAVETETPGPTDPCPTSQDQQGSTNPCPTQAVFRHHAYLANATARLERRILELDERIGRSTSTISSLVLNRREDLASITARLERQVSELDDRINALRASFTERLNALHEDRDRILTIQGQLTEQPSISSSLPIITITTPQDNTPTAPVSTSSLPSSSSSSFPASTTTERGNRRRRNNNRILEAFLRDDPGSHPPPPPPSSSSSSSRRITLPVENRDGPSEAESWHSLQQLHLHPHYSSSILDDTINRPNDALQAAINRAIAGAFMGTGEYAFANNIVPQSYRIQWWDFTGYQIPDLTNRKCNVIVPMCKLHNDASCDISQDGSCLATFVPSHRGFPDDNIMAVFSLQSHNFAQCLYTKSFGPNAISISISPKNEHVIIGLAAKRLSWVFSTHQLVAQIYQLQEVNAGEESMKHVTDVFHKCDSDVRTHVSVNSARWLPTVGEGIIYGTNRGDLVIARPCSSIITQKAESDEGISGSVSDSEGGESMNPIRRNLMNFFLTERTSTPLTLTTSTQTVSGGIRRTAGTQTSSSSSSSSSSAPLDMSMLLL